MHTNNFELLIIIFRIRLSLVGGYTLSLFVKDRIFYKTLLAIAIPITLQSMISYGVNLTDTVMLGTFGEIALSGSALANMYYAIFNVICLGLGGGSAVITAQYWGKRETEPIRHMTSILIKLTFAFAVIFAVLAFFLPTQILHIYTNETSIIEAGARFLKILSFAFLFNGLTIAMTNILRTVGIVKLPLYTTIGSFFINIFFNYVFIFGKLGFPKLEIAGSAVGTLLARIFEFLVIGGYLMFKDKVIFFRIKDLIGFDIEMFKRYIKCGLPVLISDFVMVMGGNMTSIIIGHINASFVAASSISGMVNMLVGMLSMGLASASAVITGNTIGTGDTKKAYDQGVTFISMAVIFGLVGGGIVFLVKNPIINIYNVTDLTKDYANQMIMVIVFMFAFQILEGLLTKGVLRGGGDTRFLIVGDTIFTWIASIPLGYMAAFVWGFPIWATFLCLRADQILKSILCLWRFLSKKWIKDVTVDTIPVV